MKDHEPQPLAGLDDIKLFKRVGIKGIKKLHNAKSILTRLCNSKIIVEGNY
tara:strand:- start:5024 stop:5176 length:153 start_codon:yes stop_codon:yes gene_type:complete